MNSKPIQFWSKAVFGRTALICLFAVFAFGSAFSQNWETGTLEDALAKAKVSGNLLLLDFFQEYG